MGGSAARVRWATKQQIDLSNEYDKEPVIFILTIRFFLFTAFSILQFAASGML